MSRGVPGASNQAPHPSSQGFRHRIAAHPTVCWLPFQNIWSPLASTALIGHRQSAINRPFAQSLRDTYRPYNLNPLRRWEKRRSL
ncbi:hypothetical protein CCHR01_12531 [Colletotrichum chrysophilum]|uniref:Uncharacterized protein n=1 Tax=Colletotrichum chrysophilum TaxID=1836956 RepID=A0AAD9EEM2_9PEZI|nr:hypothetical protein CCHR01_12531 [Colletotrichum chrysophilum]